MSSTLPDKERLAIIYSPQELFTKLTSHNTFVDTSGRTLDFLAQFPLQEQERLLVNAYEVGEFPNAVEFGKAVARINSLSLFSADLNMDLDFKRKLGHRMIDGSHPYGRHSNWITVETNIDTAFDEYTLNEIGKTTDHYRYVSNQLALQNNRVEAMQHAREIASSAPIISDKAQGLFSGEFTDLFFMCEVPFLMYDQAEDYLQWAAVGDLIKLENPFEIEIEVMERGGLIVGENQRKIGILTPATHIKQ